MRWLWWRFNAWGELGALIASGLAAPLLLASDVSEALRLLTIAAIGTAVAVAASLLTAPEDRERIAVFYRRTQPPGFWRDPAARHRLWLALRATGAAAGTLFALLVGLGTWLIGGSPPEPLGRGVWIALNLALAALLTPFWWKALWQEDR
jgi:hypothetical protein